MNLYELADQYLGLIEQIEDAELSQYDALSQLQTIKGEIKDKAINIGYAIKNINASISVVDAEVKRLQAIKTALTNKQNNLKSFLLFIMQNLGVNGFKHDVLPIKRVANSRPKLIIEDESLISDLYKTVESVTKVDKDALLTACQTSDIDGVRLERGEHVRIG